MYFDSLEAALTMAGHGVYVWSAYALSLLVLGYSLGWPMRRQRRLLRELRGEARRAAARGAASVAGGDEIAHDKNAANDVELS